MSRKLSFLYLLLAMAFLATGYPFAKAILNEIDPILLAFLRFFFASLFLLPIVFHQRPELPEKKSWWMLIILGFLTVLATPLFLLALHYTTTTVSSIMLNTNPLLVAVFAAFYLREKFHMTKWIALCVGFAGMAVTIINGQSLTELMQSSHFFGTLILLVAALGIALFTLFSKPYIKRYGGLTMTSLNVSIGATLLLLLTLIQGSFWELSSLSAKTWLFASLIGLISTAIPYVMWTNSMKHLKASTAASFKLFIPVFTAIYGVIFLHENLSAWIISGLVLTAMGIYLIHHEETSVADVTMD